MIMAMTSLVGNSIADLVMALHDHPDVFAKVQAEVSEKLGMDRTKMLTTEALNRLSYSRMVVDETRRLFPFVAGMLGQVSMKPCNSISPLHARTRGYIDVYVARTPILKYFRRSALAVRVPPEFSFRRHDQAPTAQLIILLSPF